MEPVKTIRSVTPPNWKKNNSESIAKWMEKLPIVKDLEQIEIIDNNYEKLLR